MVKGALGFVVSAVFVLYATTFRVVPHTSNDNLLHEVAQAANR